MNQNRITLLQDLMTTEKQDILAINAGVDLEYFTGLKFHLSERPAVLLIPSKGKPALIFPEFEQEKAKQSIIDLEFFPYPEDTGLWPKVFLQAANNLELSKKTIGVAPESMRFLEMDLIQKAAGHSHVVSAMEILKALKIQKDKEEIMAIRKAISIAEKAFMTLLSQIKPGVSEKYLANQLIIHLLTEGSEPDLPFNPIIASGPNSANPHAMPGDRVIQIGDALIIDWGARYDGYVSDLTRSFLVGGENAEMNQIAAVVLNANQAARAAARAGISASDLDKTARDVITKAGYGDSFTHRTGHGIGLLAHEDPYISQTNSSPLKIGMVFTIEPGIYLPGRGGIRIEDNILVSEEACETLTSLPREVKVI
ncbi:MAG: Xaa-Pro peptidase family protein [Pelolinea sp.]|nr:Xaa-Pro peptidase family protein [Pelolinea sp.]